MVPAHALLEALGVDATRWISHDEAQEILGRFNASRVKSALSVLDYSQFSVYIARMERIDAAAREVVRRARENWGDDLPAEFEALAKACGSKAP